LRVREGASRKLNQFLQNLFMSPSRRFPAPLEVFRALSELQVTRLTGQPQTKERTVIFKTSMLLPLAICAAWTTAADANYFHNPRLNINYSIGSARNPTPQEVRANSMPQVSETIIPASRLASNDVQAIQNYILSYGEPSGQNSVASAFPSR
jgi:hypothetical protein